MELKPQLAFPSMGEYVTIMGYRAISEHEVSEARACKITDASFNLIVGEIPWAGNRWYIGLIDYNNAVPVRFDVGEGLKVNFDATTVDNREQDWCGY